LPAEEYDWFDVHALAFRSAPDGSADLDSRSQSSKVGQPVPALSEPALNENRQRQFFEFAGPLFSVAVSPLAGPFRKALGLPSQLAWGYDDNVLLFKPFLLQNFR
jgi:hypothetical protein